MSLTLTHTHIGSPSRVSHRHSKVVYQGCPCFLVTCSCLAVGQPCLDTQALAEGTLYTGDSLFMSDETFCPTCTLLFNEWESNTGCSDEAVDSDDAETSSQTDGWEFVTEEDLDTDDDNLAQSLLLDDMDDDAHPLFGEFNRNYLTDSMLDRGAGGIAAFWYDSIMSEIHPNDVDAIKSQLEVALSEALEQKW